MPFSDIISDPQNQIRVQAPTDGVDYSGAAKVIGAIASPLIEGYQAKKKTERMDSIVDGLQQELIPLQQEMIRNPQRKVELNLRMDSVIKGFRANNPTMTNEVNGVLQSMGLKAYGNALSEQVGEQQLLAQVDNQIRMDMRARGLEQYDEETGEYSDAKTLAFGKRMTLRQEILKTKLSTDDVYKDNAVKVRQLVMTDIEDQILPMLQNILIKARQDKGDKLNLESFREATTQVKLVMNDYLAKSLNSAKILNSEVDNIKKMAAERFSQMEEIILSEDKGAATRRVRAVKNAAAKMGVDMAAAAPQIIAFQDTYGKEATTAAMGEAFTHPAVTKMLVDGIEKGVDTQKQAMSFTNIFDTDYGVPKDSESRAVQAAAMSSVKKDMETGVMKDTPQNTNAYALAVTNQAKLVAASGNAENHRKYPKSLESTLPRLAGMLNNAETSDAAKGALDSIVVGLETSVATTRRLIRDSYGDDVMEGIEYNPNTNIFTVKLKDVKEGKGVLDTVTGAAAELQTLARKRALERDLPFLQKALQMYGKVESLRRGIPEVEARKAMMSIGGVPSVEAGNRVENVPLDEEGLTDLSNTKVFRVRRMDDGKLSVKPSGGK